MIDPATPDEVRANLRRRAAERGYSLAELSRLLSRNPTYLQQYVERGRPETLHEDDRLCLAQLLMIDERELGARDPWMPTH
jgi:transcriptional regulator with XRE-family HTH domain